MSRQEAEKAAQRIMQLAKVISEKPQENRRIMIRKADLELLQKFPDEQAVISLRTHCVNNGIKFLIAKHH